MTVHYPTHRQLRAYRRRIALAAPEGERYGSLARARVKRGADALDGNTVGAAYDERGRRMPDWP